MNDQAMDRLVVVVGILLALWLAVRYRGGTQTIVQPVAAPPGTLDPNLVDYMNARPNGMAFANPKPININIGNQAANWLNSSYMPLFGFVGMAQGETYQ